VEFITPNISRCRVIYRPTRAFLISVLYPRASIINTQFVFLMFGEVAKLPTTGSNPESPILIIMTL